MFVVVNSFLPKPVVFSQKLFHSKSICSRAQILLTRHCFSYMIIMPENSK